MHDGPIGPSKRDVHANTAATHSQRIAPGKVTRTSTLAAGQSRAIQRKASTPATQDRATGARTAWEHTSDTWMDMAHRGLSALVQRQTGPGADPGADEPRAMPAAGGGASMPAEVQAKMEHAFGTDFSAVRIHEGAQASSIGALAYTEGSNIHFAPGQYDPGSQQGQELLGHELAHVVQQAQGRVRATTQAKGVALNTDAALEDEADRAGVLAAGDEVVSGLGAGIPSMRTGPIQGRFADVILLAWLQYSQQQVLAAILDRLAATLPGIDARIDALDMQYPGIRASTDRVLQSWIQEAAATWGAQAQPGPGLDGQLDQQMGKLTDRIMTAIRAAAIGVDCSDGGLLDSLAELRTDPAFEQILRASTASGRLAIGRANPGRGPHYKLGQHMVCVPPDAEVDADERKEALQFEIINASLAPYFQMGWNRYQTALAAGEDPARAAAIYAIDAERVEMATAMRQHLLDPVTSPFVMEFLQDRPFAFWLDRQVKEGHTAGYDPAATDQAWLGYTLVTEAWADGAVAIPRNNLGIGRILSTVGRAPVVPAPRQEQPPEQSSHGKGGSGGASGGGSLFDLLGAIDSLGST